MKWFRHGDDPLYDATVDAQVSAWRGSDSDLALHTYLHMTWEQYQYYMGVKL
jgi:hypothetical protein